MPQGSNDHVHDGTNHDGTNQSLPPPQPPSSSLPPQRPKAYVVHAHFKTKEDALADCIKEGYTPTAFTSTPSPELPLHWHAASTIGYVLKGQGYILDGDGNRLCLNAGDKLVIPAGAVHAEGEVKEEERVEWLSCWDNDKWLIHNVSDILDPTIYPKRKKIIWVPPFSVVWKFAMQIIKSSLPETIRSRL